MISSTSKLHFWFVPSCIALYNSLCASKSHSSYLETRLIQFKEACWIFFIIFCMSKSNLAKCFPLFSGFNSLYLSFSKCIRFLTVCCLFLKIKLSIDALPVVSFLNPNILLRSAGNVDINTDASAPRHGRSNGFPLLWDSRISSTKRFSSSFSDSVYVLLLCLSRSATFGRHQTSLPERSLLRWHYNTQKFRDMCNGSPICALFSNRKPHLVFCFVGRWDIR